MHTFKQFLEEKIILSESIRQGLPHITSMDHGQFSSLIKGGKVHVHDVTEKTDGMTHVMGHDEHGFYTQSSGSGSEKMRSPADFGKRAKARAEVTGKPFNPTASDAFAHVHSILAANKGVTEHLRKQHEKTGEDTKIRGEVFYKPLSTPSDQHKGEVKFVGTSYDPKHMGSVGKYVIHSKLPENHHVDVEKFKNHSTPSLNFDDDKIEHKSAHIDVSAEAKKFGGLNHELLTSRTTKTNKTAKEAETEKLNKIKSSVSSKVDAHVEKAGISPKWGSGSEGLVVHPSAHNPEAPRFKVTSAAFRAYRADPATKEKFKK